MSGQFHTRSGSGWPRIAALLGALLLIYYLIPLVSLTIGRSPAAVLERVGDPYVVSAAATSVAAATLSTLIATVLGVPLAYWLARTGGRVRDAVVTVVVLPLVLPPVVSGMLLLTLVGPAALGGPAAAAGLPLTRSLAGVVLAQTFVASPFLVVTALAAFEAVDPVYEEAARTLGHSPWTGFRKVTLPLARTGVLAGVTLTFARALGEFGATVMLAYYPRTLPVQIWVSYLGEGLDAALPVAVVLLGVAVVVIAALRALGADLA